MSSSSLPPPRYLGVVCTDIQYAQSQNDSALIYCLTRGQSIGLSVTVESGLLSIAAITVLLLLVVRNAIQLWRSMPNEKWSIVQEPVDIYMLSLFISDMVQAIAAAMNMKWIQSGIVMSGNYCTAQGMMKQIGESGVGMTTGVIAVHTFVSVWWRKVIHRRIIAVFVVGSIWAYTVIFATVENALDRRFETPTPYWCWIGAHHVGDRIGGEYLWLWLTLLISTLVHIPLYLLVRGNITLDPKQPWWYFEYHRHSRDERLSRGRRTSLSMLAFPATYSLLFLPISIVRWIAFANTTEDVVPSAWTFFGLSVFALTGFCNVLLLRFARPDLLLFGRVRRLHSAVTGDRHMPDQAHVEQDGHFVQDIILAQATAEMGAYGDGLMSLGGTSVSTPRGMAPSLHTENSSEGEEVGHANMVVDSHKANVRRMTAQNAMRTTPSTAHALQL